LPVFELGVAFEAAPVGSMPATTPASPDFFCDRRPVTRPIRGFGRDWRPIRETGPPPEALPEREKRPPPDAVPERAKRPAPPDAVPERAKRPAPPDAVPERAKRPAPPAVRAVPVRPAVRATRVVPARPDFVEAAIA
jgi:hypothetical protein